MVVATDFQRMSLSDGQMETARSIGAERSHSNRLGGFKTRQVDSTSSGRSLDYVGAVGEVAYALRYGVPLTQIRVDEPGGDGGWDFLTQSEKTVDVKICPRGTESRYGNLVRRDLDKHADIYYLTWLAAPQEVDLIGVISRIRFDRMCHRMPTGIGWYVPWELLAPISRFEEWMNRRAECPPSQASRN